MKALLISLFSMFLSWNSALCQPKFLLNVSSEVAVQINHNFFPPDLLAFVDAGAYVPILRSGEQWSLGADAQIKAGQHVVLENIFVLSIPMYVAARYYPLQNSDWGLGASAGAGLEYYSRNNSIEKTKQIDLRPSVFLEIIYRVYGRPLFVRYNLFFTSGDLTKHGLQMGIYFEF